MVTIFGKITSYFCDFLETNSLATLSAWVSLAESQNQDNHFCVLEVMERITLATNITSESTGSIITSFITKALSKLKAFSLQNLSQLTGYYENKCTKVFGFCVILKSKQDWKIQSKTNIKILKKQFIGASINVIDSSQRNTWVSTAAFRWAL